MVGDLHVVCLRDRHVAGGNATIHTRIGGEREDIDIHIEEGRVRGVLQMHTEGGLQ